MPSLPELEVYKQQLTQDLVGQVINRVEALDFRVVHATVQDLEKLLTNHAVKHINRYGKWLIWEVGESRQLIMHLGLTGRLHVLLPDEKLPRYACLMVEFEVGRRLVLSDARHLGKVLIHNLNDLRAEKSLGPDLLSLPEADFIALGQQHRNVRDVLMDQKLIAGIGGKYADEILWQAKLNPHTKMSALSPSQLHQLYRLTMSVTQEAIARRADVGQFSSDWLIPHRHTDQICPRCRGPLVTASSAFHCPQCQA